MIEKIKETGRKVWIFTLKVMAVLFIYLLGGMTLPQSWHFTNLMDAIISNPQWITLMSYIVVGGVTLFFAVLAITFLKKE